MNIVQGDLLTLASNGEFDVIVHGCNCQCVMGAGIAKSVKERFPAAFQADLATTKGAREKMGTITTATVEENGNTFVIVNAYTQFHWRGPEGKVEYDSLRSAFARVREQFAGKRIGYPLIGAGLGGGDWNVIAKIIDEELAGEDHTLVEFQP